MDWINAIERARDEAFELGDWRTVRFMDLWILETYSGSAGRTKTSEKK